MTRNTLVQGLMRLPGGDKALLRGFVVMSLLTLGLGLVYGALTGFARAGFVELDPALAYRMLTLHGVTIFFYWLYFAQSAFVLILASVYTEGAGAVAWRPLAWLGFALMVAGFGLSELMPTLGAVMLYDGQPDLIGYDMTKGGFFYLGYLLLAAGLFLVATSAIATALKPRFEGTIETWSSISFASVAWAGLLMVSALAAINAFLPAAWWAFGFGAEPAAYTMSWHVLFHNVHYLPLMATVVIWYVLVEVMAGVKSIFGQRFSKIVFASYLVFVPPTSLYHMFLEPNLADAVRVTGSLLSLFIGVPTVLVFLIVVASLETHARAHGARGLFGWMRMLPWRNPAMSAIGMAVVNTALGGALAFVLIQEKLAPLLSDTFFVPGYFHFLTLGTVTLTFIAALMYVIPGLTGRPLWNPGLLAKLPYVMTFGLLIFGAAGIVAGYQGVPRRLFDVSYEGSAPEIWGTLMAIVGIGAVFMTIALAVFVFGLVMTLFARAREAGAADLPVVSWGGVATAGQAAWVGPLAVVVLIAGMYVFTALGFELMQSLPLVASGDAGH
ncbi:MAG: cbb3-type cytochrome c oxidase subunit I [Alphaproteobacteria bacterium]